LRKLGLTLIALVVLATASFGVLTIANAGGSSKSEDGAAKANSSADVPEASIDPSARDEEYKYPKPRPRVAVAVRPGEEAPPAIDDTPSEPSSSNGEDAKRARASDAEVREELAEFRRYLAKQGPTTGGPVAKVDANGMASAPRNAPAVVKKIIAGGNAIALTPYLWGGGHGAWEDEGYDCSGSISFALAGAGLLESPLTSGLFMNWGEPGPGKWVTIYANGGHAFMVVAGLRFDTSGRGANQGTRWQQNMRSTDGFVAVHPPGL
jgi:cell wall-associated NlpC family hydrolase